MALARCNLVVQDTAGNIVNGATISVIDEDTAAPATVYSDRSGLSSLGSSFVAVDGADAGFHAYGGVYKITATKGAFSKVWRYVPIGTAAENDAPGGLRELLTAARTYYVRTDGSDSNTGLANTSGGAFLTVQKAVDTVQGLDLNGYDVTVQVANGTYTGAVNLKDPIGAGNCTIQGDTTSISTWDDVIFNVTGAASTDAAVKADGSVKWIVKAVRLQTVTRGNLLYATARGQIRYEKIIFGQVGSATADYHMLAEKGGRIERVTGGDAGIAAAAAAHYAATTKGEIFAQGGTVTVQGSAATYNYPFGFAYSSGQSRLDTFSETYTLAGNTITGARCVSERQSTIFTNGVGATYFPGNATVAPDATSLVI